MTNQNQLPFDPPELSEGDQLDIEYQSVHTPRDSDNIQSVSGIITRVETKGTIDVDDKDLIIGTKEGTTDVDPDDMTFRPMLVQAYLKTGEDSTAKDRQDTESNPDRRVSFMCGSDGVWVTDMLENKNGGRWTRLARYNSISVEQPDPNPRSENPV